MIDDIEGALEEHGARLVERFGAGTGTRLLFVPGRVNLMGAHLDYNGGPVMPTAIDRGTFLAARPRADGRLRLASTLERDEVELALDDLPAGPSGAWHDYPVGVARFLLAGPGPSDWGDAGPPCGLELFFGGNLAIGAGLSSSASICVATAIALDRAWGLGGGASEHVEAALYAEREFVGVRCGIMDPNAVARARPGALLWLDCKDATFEHLPLDARELSIAVADTGVRRELAQGAFNERVEECRAAFDLLRPHADGATVLRDVPLELVLEHARDLGPTLSRRARHVASEVERTLQARADLKAGDHARFGSRITAAHESLRDLFEVSTPELDLLVDASASWDGVLGARLTGAGFGGCVVILLRSEAREGFAEHLAGAFGRAFGRPPAVTFFGGSPGVRELGS